MGAKFDLILLICIIQWSQPIHVSVFDWLELFCPRDYKSLIISLRCCCCSELDMMWMKRT